MIYQGKKRYPVREAVLHCAAINTGQFKHMTPFQVFTTVNQWHTERGWRNGFGYHGLIMPDGTFFPGRPYTMIGAHCIERNRGSLGFLLIESRKIDRMGEFSDYFTQHQCQQLLQLLDIDGLEKVSGHNDYAPKLCPGFKVVSDDWLPRGATPSFPRSGDNFRVLGG